MRESSWMPLLFIYFLVGMVAGAVHAYRLIMTARQAVQRPGTLQAWTEAPTQSWRTEPHATRAILIQTLSILVLGFLAMRAASNEGILANPLFADDTTMAWLVWFAESGSLIVIGYQLGASLIAFPLIVFRREPAAVGITEEGLAYGRNLLPWHWFSHFSVDRDLSILRLFSAFSPDLPSISLKLPASVPLPELYDTVHGFLHPHPLAGKRAWYQTKYLLLPAMLLACLPVLVVGWVASRFSRELALFAIAVLITLLAYLGGIVLNTFAFGVHNAGKISLKQRSAD